MAIVSPGGGATPAAIRVAATLPPMERMPIDAAP